MLQTKNRLNLMKLENLTHDHKNFLGKYIKASLFFVFLVIAGYANAQSCPLACNNLVQVSLDDDCRVEITPDMMLEGQGTDPLCTYAVTVMGANGVPIVGSPFVTGTQIDKTLTVKVSLGTNSCWGSIKVEDKLAPKINCPDDLTITCYDNRTFALPTATDNCGGLATVKLISNELEDRDCTDEDYTAIRVLTYQATDAKGNKSQLCVRTVYYEAIDFDDLVFPKNRDDVESPSLSCSGLKDTVLANASIAQVLWDKNKNGYPDVAETGAPTIGGYPVFPNVSLCEVNATFTDQKIQICANSFKVLREWTVLNWCSGEIEKDFQVIKVVDNEGPVVTCPEDKTSPYDPNVKVADILSSDPYTCTASWNVIAPVVIFDCGVTTYTIDYLLADANGNAPVNGVYINDNVVKNANGTFTIKDLPVGRTWLRYTITDACGNSSPCFTEVDVVDNVPPVAVCDEFTVVTLTTGGVAQIFAQTFDDGSHDNCTAVMLDARRMTPGCSASTVNWTNAVNFCCEDVGKEIMVSLRVTDKNNNVNSCMVIVRVQDKIAPKIVCPAAITINCDQDKENLDLVGRPVASDNCFASIPTKIDNGTLNQCGVGTFTRTWSTRDNNVPALTASCTQRITVQNKFPFKASDINWSAVSGVKLLEGCIDIDTDPSKTGKPTWTSDACDLIASTYTDQLFNVVDSACFKILRTWTVIDWCSFDQNNPGAGGIFQFTQVIKLNNKKAPDFDSCADISECAYGEKCDGFVTLKKTATDDCTPENLLVWNWSLDLGNDGTTDKTGKNTDASGTYPVGKHKLTWTVEDKCGNKATCVQFVTLRDCKKPTPYCLSEVTTVVMPSTDNIDIWASDFDKGSFDNCPGTLKISFSTVVTDTKRTFTCSNLGLNDLRMYVTDAAGNQEYCSVKVNIQSNPGGCGGANEKKVIAGTVGTDKNRMVDNVTVRLESSEVMLAKTDVAGAFKFQGMPLNATYNVTAENNENYLNGVSTLDLVMIQRHILGAQKLNSAFNIVAADVNNDTKISASDLVELRKLILGVYTKLPSNKSWRFLDANQTFADASKPFPFSESVKVNIANTSVNNVDLKAIKIGDVNESASVNVKDQNAEPRTNKTLKLEIGQQAFEKGNRIIVPVYAGSKNDISGLQFTMKLNSNLKVIGVVPGAINMTDDNIAITGSTFAASFASASSIEVNQNDELFALVLEAVNAGSMTNSIQVTNDVVKSEAYNTELEIMNVALTMRNGAVASEVSLMQNVPNPFQTTTTIQFMLPEAQKATLKVFDITGKTVYSKEGEYVKGQNQVVLHSEQLGAGGVLYYQLETKGYTSTKKMIMMNK
jgi:hypothetical protein